MGFPAAGQVAASLCYLLDGLKQTTRVPRELVQQHALAIRAIAHESQQNVPNEMADRLAARLTSVTDDYIGSLS